MTIEIIHRKIYKPFVYLCIIVSSYISIIRAKELALEEQTPSAREFYEEKRRPSRKEQAIEYDRESNQLLSELEEVENYNLSHRRKKKHPWIHVRIVCGENCHKFGCSCTPPEIVEQNEEMRRQKWKQICKERKLTKKEQEHKDRWDNEQEQFDKWRMKWGFY